MNLMEVALRFTQAAAHALWFGALIALAAFALERLFVRTASTRHLVNLTALILLTLSFPIAFALTPTPNRPAPSSIANATGRPANPDPRSGAINAATSIPVSSAEPLQESTAAPSPAPTITDTLISWEKIAPWAAGGYLTGLIAMLLRMSCGFAGSARLRRQSEPVNGGIWTEALKKMGTRVKTRTRPALKWSREVAAPLIIGFAKPTILLPIALASRLTPEQVEAVLAHELAHLRRRDAWALAIQRLAETLLFFHPAVWWLSHRVNVAREEACDDLVLAAKCNPADYAEALVICSEFRLEHNTPSPTLVRGLSALGKTEKHLRRRVLRLIGNGDGGAVRLGPTGWVLGLLLISGLSIAIATGNTSQADPANPTSTPPQSASQTFGPVIERLLTDADDNKGNEILNLKTGAATSLTKVQSQAGGRIRALLQGDGDLYAEYDQWVGRRWGLITSGLKLSDLLPTQWETASASDITNALAAPTAVEHVTPKEFPSTFLYLLPDGLQPITFAFQTRQGARGILQITGFTENPRGVKLRYKLLQNTTTTTTNSNIASPTAEASPDSDSQWSPPANGLQCRLLPTKQTAPPSTNGVRGISVYLTYELRNVTDKPIKFLPYYTPLETVGSGDVFRILDSNSNPVAYRGIWRERIAPTAKSFITIAPGQTVTNRVGLPYDFSKPGTYRIRSSILRFGADTLPFYYRDYKARTEINPDNVWFGKLESNEVQVEILSANTPEHTLRPQWSQPSNGLQCRLLPQKQTLHPSPNESPDACFNLTYELRNVTDKPIRTLAVVMLEEVSSDATNSNPIQIPHPRYWRQRFDPTARHFITIGPGQTVTIPLQPYYDFSKPGTYRIKSIDRSLKVGSTLTLPGYPATDNVWYGDLESNEVQVEITPSTNSSAETFSSSDSRQRFLAVEKAARLPQSQQATVVPQLYRELPPRALSMLVEGIPSSSPQNILNRDTGIYGGNTRLWAQQLADAAPTLTPEQVANNLGTRLWLDLATRARALSVFEQHPNTISNLIAADLATHDTNAHERAAAVIWALDLKAFTPRLLEIWLASDEQLHPVWLTHLFLHDPSIIKPLLDRVDKDPKLLVRCASLFQGTLYNKPVEPVLFELLDSPDPEIRYSAAYALAECIDPRLAQPAARLVKEADPRSRLIAAHIVAKLPDHSYQAVRPQLLPLLSDQDLQVRYSALLSFAKRKDFASAPVILEALQRNQFEDQYKASVMHALSALTGNTWNYYMHEWGPTHPGNQTAIANFEAWLKQHAPTQSKTSTTPPSNPPAAGEQLP